MVTEMGRMPDQCRARTGGGRARAERQRPSHRSISRREFPAQEVILDLLEKAEALREHQNLLRWKLDHALATGNGGSGYEYQSRLSPVEIAQLRQAWEEFIAAGGVTADDLRRYVCGEKIGEVRPVQRQHLRLVRLGKPTSHLQRYDALRV